MGFSTLVIVFDTSFLSLLLVENHSPMTNQDTGDTVEDVGQRVQQLIINLQNSKTKILIPTPVLAEILTEFADKSGEIIQVMEKTYQFQFAPFDKLAAIELGYFFHQAINEGDKKSGSKDTWQKVKFDNQIVAIAKTNGAKTIYTNDKGIRISAQKHNIEVITVWDLDPPPPEQGMIDYPEENQT